MRSLNTEFETTPLESVVEIDKILSIGNYRYIGVRKQKKRFSLAVRKKMPKSHKIINGTGILTIHD